MPPVSEISPIIVGIIVAILGPSVIFLLTNHMKARSDKEAKDKSLEDRANQSDLERIRMADASVWKVIARQDAEIKDKQDRLASLEGRVNELQEQVRVITEDRDLMRQMYERERQRNRDLEVRLDKLEKVAKEGIINP